MKKIKKNNQFSLLLKIFFLFSYVSITNEKNNRNLNNYDSIIQLIISGKGNQTILSDYFKYEPSEVIINGISKGKSCKKSCYFDEDINNVTLKFQYDVDTCDSMFYKLNNITEIDLSKFDASKITSMYFMFADCINLEKIKFGNINTSSVNNMYCIFCSCKKLSSIDLSKFDTSKVTDMEGMFNECNNLKYLDLSNFNTSLVKSMRTMFQKCTQLIEINLSNFDTSQVTDMGYMFNGCNNLKYLDLSNFNPF